MLEDLVPNIGLKLSKNTTRGRSVYVEGHKSNIASVKTLRADSFLLRGPRLFNCLPPNLKNITKVTVETFKKNLDILLSKIEDTPPTKSYPCTWPKYNKLENLIPLYNRSGVVSISP